MSLLITLDGVDVTSHVDLESILITSNLATTLDTAKLTMPIADQEIPRPRGGQELIIDDDAGREFGGIATIITEDQPGVPTQLDYGVQARDYSFLLDRHLAVKEYASGAFSYGAIVVDLVKTYAAQDGFTTKGVAPSFTADFVRFDYQPLSQCIGLLANQVSWPWWVDYYRDVKFAPITTVPSPLPGNVLLIDSATTAADSDYGQLGVYGDLQIVEDVSQVKNRVFLRGHKVAASYFYTETFKGDGSTLKFPLAYEPSHALAANVHVTVGGTSYTVKADIAAGSPSSTSPDTTAYINFRTLNVRFNVAPANGTTISVQYRPMLPLVVMVEDPVAQAEMKARTGLNDGVFEYSIADPSMSGDDTGPARARGLAAIAKYGSPHMSGTFTSFLHGWKSGQYFYATSSRRFGGEIIAKQLFVTKVQKKLVTHPSSKKPLWQSTISFSDNAYVV